MGSVLIAYSGGVDSSFLVAVACRILGKRVLAVTAVSETYQAGELGFAKSFCRRLGARHRLLRTYELKNPSFRLNPENRCYYCKDELFGKLKKMAAEEGLSYVLDGSNADDKKDYRPGALARAERGVFSPLQEAGLTKEDIRTLSKKMKLSTWAKPAMACLASRIPYHSRITTARLRRVERAEEALRKNFGLTGNVRVRDYGGFARIEVDRQDIARLAASPKTEAILKRIGYRKIVIDPEGYRTGSMNPVRDTASLMTKRDAAMMKNEYVVGKMTRNRRSRYARPISSGVNETIKRRL